MTGRQSRSEGWERCAGAWFFLGALLFSACGGPKATESPGHATDQVVPSDGSETSQGAVPKGNRLVGQELYRRKCARCHGAITDATSPLVQLAQRQPDAVTAVIQQGRGTMPSFGDRLPAALIEDVVTYLQAGGEPEGQ